MGHMCVKFMFKHGMMLATKRVIFSWASWLTLVCVFVPRGGTVVLCLSLAGQHALSDILSECWRGILWKLTFIDTLTCAMSFQCWCCISCWACSVKAKACGYGES